MKRGCDDPGNLVLRSTRVVVPSSPHSFWKSSQVLTTDEAHSSRKHKTCKWRLTWAVFVQRQRHMRAPDRPFKELCGIWVGASYFCFLSHACRFSFACGSSEIQSDREAAIDALLGWAAEVRGMAVPNSASGISGSHHCNSHRPTMPHWS